MRHKLINKTKFKRTTNSNKKLRKLVLKKMKKCHISGYTNPLEIQLSHIIPKFMNRYLCYNTDTELNCWLLSNGLHTLFDNFHWTVDIFSLMDLNNKSESEFKTFLLMKNKPIFGSSQLANYVDKVLTIPIKYFPSLYAHYYCYLNINYNGGICNQSWKYITNTHEFKQFSSCKTKTQIIEYIKSKRIIHKANDYMVIKRDKDKLCIVKNFWSFSHKKWIKV